MFLNRSLMANRPCFLRRTARRFALIAVFALGSSPLRAQSGAPGTTYPASDSPAVSPSAPAHSALLEPQPEATEMRGLWVVRDSLTSPQSIRQVVQTAVKYHLNALFVQVRGRGDAWYQSPYEPRAELLWKQPSDFDPLRQIITEAHAHGIEVHAWLNTYLTWSGPRPPRSKQHLWNAHRDWFARDRQNHCSAAVTAHSEGAFLSPGHPAVQEHLFQVFTQVARSYDVDGVHFDYCRYGGPNYDFGPVALAQFRKAMLPCTDPDLAATLDARRRKDRLAWVHAFPEAWADWRREQVTGLVARIAQAVRAENPDIQVSAAVFADARDAFGARGQDWRRWLKEGHLDAVALMAYAKSTERILEQTRQAVEAAGENGQVYTGIGAWRLSAHDVAKKIAQVRKTGAAGVNLFSYNGVHTRPNYLETLRRGVFASRAAPPRNRVRRQRIAPEPVVPATTQEQPETP